MTPRRAHVAFAWLIGLSAACCARAHAQDFAPAAGAGPAPGACALLERALPVAADRGGFEALTSAWALVPALGTRAVAGEVALHSLRMAAGLSQTGEPELGWTCAALALGAADHAGGCALRVALRRDRIADAPPPGIEAGGGAWLTPARGVSLWASAPQCMTRGAPPPQARPLELGGGITSGAARVWFAIEGPGRGGDGERAVGLELARGAATVWGEARDGPWRATLGVALRVRAIACAVRLESHPLLGTRTTLALGLRAHAAHAAGVP